MEARSVDHRRGAAGDEWDRIRHLSPKASYPEIHFLLFSGQPGTSGLLEDAKRKGHLFEILAKPLHPSFMLATVADMLSSPPVEAGQLPN